MIKGKDVYNILESIMPLYVAMILGYCSIKWWKIFTPEQCNGINRFVAMFAVPTLTFIYISPINPYHMNWRLIVADTLQKVVTLVVLIVWNIFTKRGGFDWSITIFSLTNLPNTLVVGIPLLNAMYGEFTTSLLIQILVMQSVLWYTILLIMYEYRAAKIFISKQFNETNNEGSHKSDSIVEVEIGEIWNKLQAKSNSSSRRSQNGGFEINMSKMKERRFIRRSRSCNDKIYDEHLMVSSFHDLKSTFSSKSVNEAKIKRIFSGRLGKQLQEIEESDVNKLIGRNSSHRGSGVKEHEKEDGIKHQLTEGQNEIIIDIKEEILENEQQMLRDRGTMTKLVLIRVYKKLSTNPNIYAAVLAIVWALIASRWNIKMPTIIHDSITIISHTGLGMSMFSIGIFMALQPKIIACGKTAAAMSMVLKFLVGPLLFAATSASVGIRGVILKVGIIQAALPQGVVPFVFAKEYGLHAEIFNTAVIFGLAIAFPIAIIYYVILSSF